MTTAQPAQQPPDPPSPAGLTARLTAKIVDTTITTAISFVALMWLSLQGLSILVVNETTDSEAYQAASLFIAVLLFEAATVVATAWKGRTPGKKLLGIKVIARSDSLPPTAMQAVVRWGLPLIATVPLLDAFIRDIPDLANNEAPPALSGRAWWLWVALGWWLLVHASALWHRDRRGLHDRAAGTIVIKAPRHTRPAHPALTQPTGWPTSRRGS